MNADGCTCPEDWPRLSHFEEDGPVYTPLNGRSNAPAPDSARQKKAWPLTRTDKNPVKHTVTR